MQALETMKKLKDIKGYVRLPLEKLPGITDKYEISVS